jgi:hypothetical protein
MNEFNLSVDDTYIVFKLATGEQLIAVKRDETITEVTIEYPMLVKSYAFENGDDGLSEHVTATPFCKFSEDKVFTFRKTDIIFLKTMHRYAIPFYVNLVKQYEATIPSDDNGEETIEELSDRVDRLMEHLKSLADNPEEETEAPVVVKAPGNNTFH